MSPIDNSYQKARNYAEKSMINRETIGAASFWGHPLTSRTWGDMDWGLTFQRTEPCRKEPGWMHPGRCMIIIVRGIERRQIVDDDRDR